MFGTFKSKKSTAKLMKEIDKELDIEFWRCGVCEIKDYFPKEHKPTMSAELNNPLNKLIPFRIYFEL